MKTFHSIEALRKAISEYRRRGKTIGFVPTMGYLHEGHLALIRQAKKECDICVVSIFVNPKQFGPKEDLAKYPRDLKRDSSLIQKENVDILFSPPDNTIYPKRYLTYIDVAEVSQGLCGEFRPGHFRGVATVVAKLLNIVEPDTMYLGQKDAQQVAVLKAMAADLNFPVKIKSVPTVREKDGLAMSSRNVYLSAQERKEAAVLYKALNEAKAKIKAGERNAERILSGIKKTITANSSGKIQYVACVNIDTLEPLKVIQGHVLIALAVYFGKTRLIDNVTVRVNESSKTKN